MSMTVSLPERCSCSLPLVAIIACKPVAQAQVGRGHQLMPAGHPFPDLRHSSAGSRGNKHLRLRLGASAFRLDPYDGVDELGNGD